MSRCACCIIITDRFKKKIFFFFFNFIAIAVVLRLELCLSLIFCLRFSDLCFELVSKNFECVIRSVQFKMVSMHSEKTICAPPRLSEVSPMLPCVTRHELDPKR